MRFKLVIPGRVLTVQLLGCPLEDHLVFLNAPIVFVVKHRVYRMARKERDFNISFSELIPIMAIE